MKLNETPRLSTLDPLLQRELREHATQVNKLTQGYIAAVDNARTAAPTTGSWKRGDFIRNSEPSLVALHGAGPGAHNYVLHGWICTASGTPGTWHPCHYEVD